MATGAEAIAARAQRSINFLINNEIYLSNKARTTLRYMSAKEKNSWTKGGKGPLGPLLKKAVEQIVYISTIWTERKEFLEATETQENTLVEVSVSMNTTANGASSWSCSRLINTVADKIGQTIAYNLILLSSRVGNSLIVSSNYLQNNNLEKTDKYADRKYGYVWPALSNISDPCSPNRVARYLVAYWW